MGKYTLSSIPKLIYILSLASPGRDLILQQQHVVAYQAELPRRCGGPHQQADQHGVLRQLVYLSMASWFNRDDQALPGFAKFFSDSSTEERQHGITLMEYQCKRGGRVVFQDISKPNSMEWGTPLEALEAALELEKTVNESLLSMHKVADSKNDPHH